MIKPVFSQSIFRLAYCNHTICATPMKTPRTNGWSIVTYGIHELAKVNCSVTDRAHVVNYRPDFVECDEFINLHQFFVQDVDVYDIAFHNVRYLHENRDINLKANLLCDPIAIVVAVSMT